MVSRTEKWEINMQERVNKLNQIRTERQNRFDDRKENRDERNANRKQENDKRWEEYFAKMEAKAQTDAQKQAVLNFKKAVLAAIQAKRTAIETANGIFKATVQQVINERKSSVDTLAAQFRTEVQAAIQKAKNDCSTGSDPVQVRETLRVAIKAARDKFQSGRQEIEKIQGKLEVARNAHQTAVKNAQTSFKTALETAKNIFKAAIGAPSPTPTPTPTIDKNKNSYIIPLRNYDQLSEQL